MTSPTVTAPGVRPGESAPAQLHAEHTARPRTVDPTRDPEWERLVTTRPSGVFSSPPWLRVLSATYAFPLRGRILGDEAGAPRAGLLHAEVDDVRGERLVTLPFSDFCDPIAPDREGWLALTAGLFEGARHHVVRCLHATHPGEDPRLTAVGRARWHAIDVQRDEEEIWASLHPSARRAIRKADSAGVSVEHVDDESGLRAFFELHLRVRKYKYGLLAQPYAFFVNIWEQFLSQDRGTLVLAKVDGEPVAGCLFLEWQDTLYYKFNASDADRLGVRPNDRVLWEGVRHARERGLARLDFGLTDWDQDGLIQYKRKYATEEGVITTYRNAPAGADGRAGPAVGELLAEMTDLLVGDDVPDAVTERAGEIVYRYFA
jgi:CelD/BcsL family acetyltransferase involved in cellulose biosynthesis